MARHRSRSRRRRRTVWFVPRTGAGVDNDATFSCWADVGVGFFPKGSASTPNFIISPILGSLVQAIDPTIDPDMAQKPSTERWRVERIVGDVAVQAIQLGDPNAGGAVLRFDGVDVHMGVVRRDATADAVSPVFPVTNNEALADWLWMDHWSMSTAETVCHNCTGQTSNPGGDCDTLCDAIMPTALTGFQVFGVPNLVWRHVDIRVKRTIRPEQALQLVIQAEVAPAAVNFVALSVQPKLRVLLSRSV